MEWPINTSILEQLYFLRSETENHCALAEVYMTRPDEVTAQRLSDRAGYRRTLQEKVELAVALSLYRRKIDSPVFQQAKSLERLARLLDLLGQACIEFTLIEPLKKDTPGQAPENQDCPGISGYAKLLRRVRKSLKLVMINPDDANTRQGLKLGRRARRLMTSLKDQQDKSNTAPTELNAVLHFQLGRMIRLLMAMADALLAANFGPAIRLQNYKQLRNAARIFSPGTDSFGVERLALTRSGSTIAALRAAPDSSGDVMAVYKEGQADKVLEEVSGVAQWKEVFPKVAPSVISHQVEDAQNTGSMVLEHLPGYTLEHLLLNGQWDNAGLLVKRLTRTLGKIWKTSRIDETAEPGYMKQLEARMPEVRQAHPALFTGKQTLCGLARPGFDDLILQIRHLETGLNPPFCVLIHGDFNVDNLIYDQLQNRIYFIDLHRASYSDYVQDISVLMTSIYRLPITDPDARARTTGFIRQLYQFSRRFARTSRDTCFEARLAIALARSLATSTRFIYDTGFAKRLAFRSVYLLESITAFNPDKLEKYRLPLEEIFHE